MRSCTWPPHSWPSGGPFQWPRSVRPGLIFPLDALTWLHSALVSKLQAACKAERDLWHGLCRLAVDKTTLTLPQSQSLLILARKAHFIIPATKNMSPRVLRTLGPGDYHCRITDSRSGRTLEVRVVFVYRNGFRRCRLVTSLLDPSLYPASELAQLYHMRWDIETFYRDFKHTLYPIGTIPAAKVRIF